MSSGGGTGTTVTDKANEMTRNMILGIPKEGLKPDSPEAADLQAAEAFVSDIQQEILAYDIANAKAMEAYAMRWWSRVPFFGRHAKEALENESAAAQLQQEQVELGGALKGLDAAAAAAAAKAGTEYLHTTSGTTTRGGFKVERTSALDQEQLKKLPKKPQYNTWLFKVRHPNWVPLMQRWWVPWVCLGCIGLIWTPDVWKLRTLYYLDHQYALFRQSVHKAYWRATMSKEDYEQLMSEIEAQRPITVKSTDCPF